MGARVLLQGIHFNGCIHREGCTCGPVNNYQHIIFSIMTDYAVESRGRTRALITRIHNDMENFESYDKLKLRTLKLKLEKAENELNTLDMEIIDAMYGDDKSTAAQIKTEIDKSFHYKEEITEALALVMECLEQVALDSRAAASGHAGTGTGNMAQPHSQLQRPKAPLPRFEGLEGESITLFLENFNASMSKFNYTEYDKLLLLQEQVSGKAKMLVKHLVAGRHKLADAEELLKNAFAAKDLQKFNIIKQLSELSMPAGSEPFEFLSAVQSIRQAVDTLQLEIDDILAYFVLIGMNEMFRTQLTLVTNCTRPDIGTILDKFFVAAERYEIVRKGTKQNKAYGSTNQTTAMAAGVAAKAETVQNPFKNCTLCSSGVNNHAINKCPNYIKPSEKLNRLRQLNACLRCANLGHFATACKFRFKSKCRNCDHYHFTFLCDGTLQPSVGSRNGNSSKTPAKQSTSSNAAQSESEPTNSEEHISEAITSMQIVCASYFQENMGEVDSVLSTFTISKHNTDEKIRGLYDQGSQSSFVLENLLPALDHTVLNNCIKLTIKGINNTKTITSKLVEVRLMFGNHCRTVKMLTVPNINISLQLPGLPEVVRQFRNKGFKLADELLDCKSTVLGNMGLILGADAGHCFVGRTVDFGQSSVYMECKFGILLLGSVNAMLRDKLDLPNCKLHED